VQIKQLRLKNFRCFSEQVVSLDHSLVLVQGSNGSGKTSLLEALHYLCYLRSFRTHVPKELVHFDATSFFMKIDFVTEGLEHEIQVGFSGKKRVVKFNQKALQSFKELMDHYRIITITEDDVFIIKGSPEVRRSFLDQAIVLRDPDYPEIFKKFKAIVDNRNSLLMRGMVASHSYYLWTEQLWDFSYLIQQKRVDFLQLLQKRVNKLIRQLALVHEISFRYEPKNSRGEQSFDDFKEAIAQLKQEEERFKRSLFGAHLDDFSIMLHANKSRTYASRGQQKLIAFLLKIAHLEELIHTRGKAILLLDDFLTDFDEKVAVTLLDLLATLSVQIIITSPLQGQGISFLEDLLIKRGALQEKIDIQKLFSP
jgi:DNA replication and repair protein RecF